MWFYVSQTVKTNEASCVFPGNLLNHYLSNCLVKKKKKCPSLLIGHLAQWWMWRRLGSQVSPARKQCAIDRRRRRLAPRNSSSLMPSRRDYLSLLRPAGLHGHWFIGNLWRPQGRLVSRGHGIWESFGKRGGTWTLLVSDSLDRVGNCGDGWRSAFKGLELTLKSMTWSLTPTVAGPNPERVQAHQLLQLQTSSSGKKQQQFFLWNCENCC